MIFTEELEPELEEAYKRVLEMPREDPEESLERDFAFLKLCHIMSEYHKGSLSLQSAKHLLNKIGR